MESLPLGVRAKQGLAVLALEARGWGFGERVAWPGPGCCRWWLSGCGGDDGQGGAQLLSWDESSQDTVVCAGLLRGGR